MIQQRTARSRSARAPTTRNYHFLDGRTGEPIATPYCDTGDLAKGSATSDPDGFPLYYAGSRDDLLPGDRDGPSASRRCCWTIDADTTVPRPLWNNDWDGAALVVGDYLLEGGENGWFYVVQLNRGYDDEGLVTVDPEIVATIPGFDDELLGDLGDEEVSIENSVAFRDGVAYFANSGGLVQGWDISDLLGGGTAYSRVFRFWTGDDTDASIVIDDEGFLYVASEYQRFNERAQRARPAHEARSVEARRPGGVVDRRARDRVRGGGRELVDPGAVRGLRVLHDRRRTGARGRRERARSLGAHIGCPAIARRWSWTAS